MRSWYRRGMKLLEHHRLISHSELINYEPNSNATPNSAPAGAPAAAHGVLCRVISTGSRGAGKTDCGWCRPRVQKGTLDGMQLGSSTLEALVLDDEME
jgi:hypothetical protein